jgi:hypothetical protein
MPETREPAPDAAVESEKNKAEQAVRQERHKDDGARIKTGHEASSSRKYGTRGNRSGLGARPSLSRFFAVAGIAFQVMGLTPLRAMAYISKEN